MFFGTAVCSDEALDTAAGKKLAFPVLIAPMAMQRMAHSDGELAVARAAAKAGIPMVCATVVANESRVDALHCAVLAAVHIEVESTYQGVRMSGSGLSTEVSV